MNFLHLEDNEADAELAEHLILREWPDCRITRLSTRPQFEAALNFGKFDLILSDYSMPGFDGLSALEMVRATCPETPFIFLSGTLGEERAIDALKQGATDYLLKGSTARLIPAIRATIRSGEQESAKRRAEESLRKSREQFQQIAESINDFIVLLNAHGQCLYSNPAFQRLLGGERAPVGLDVLEHVHPQDRERLRASLQQARQSTGPRDAKFRLLLADGNIRHVETQISLPEYRDQETPTLLLAGRDVTERQAAEELLHEQASLLGKARDAICLMSLSHVITYWNTSAERTYGISSAGAIGSNARELLFATQLARFDDAFGMTLALGEWHGEFQLRMPDAREMVINSTWSLINDIEGRPKSILCIDTDVTARKQLERELQRAQRIEGLGMLAGGIAHDLNNVLSPILLSIGLLRPLATTPNDCQIFDAMETSASHGADLVQQILLFARGGEGQRARVDLGRLLDETAGFLKTILRKAVSLHVNCDADLAAVEGDATQLKQVIVNLCVNARDAMPRGGSLQITATNKKILPGSVRGFHGEIPAGSYVRLSMADTGTGIPPDVLEKIFDPFFTTKGIGKGTGLGLSTIMGIVQNHDGAIQVESLSGLGTTFHIYLPAAAARAQRPRSVRERMPAGHGECILIIDDDDGVRFVAEKILSMQGYDVCTACDGETGLEEFGRQRDRIQVVICDQMMPGLSGDTVLARIHRAAPHVKLITMSGLHQDLSHSPFEAGGSIVILPKPLEMETLLHAVHQAIANTAS